jgi:hypothetical protein
MKRIGLDPVEESLFEVIMEPALNIVIFDKFKSYLAKKGEIKVSLESIMVKADDALQRYIGTVIYDHFYDFWDDIKEKLSPLEQEMAIYYILIHSTQDVDVAKLMRDRDDIIKLLNGKVDPMVNSIIKNLVVYIPDDTRVELVHLWILSRKKVFENDKVLCNYIYHEDYFVLFSEEEHEQYENLKTLSSDRTPAQSTANKNRRSL